MKKLIIEQCGNSIETIEYFNEMIKNYGERIIEIFAQKMIPVFYESLHVELPENKTIWQKRK